MMNLMEMDLEEVVAERKEIQKKLKKLKRSGRSREEVAELSKWNLRLKDRKCELMRATKVRPTAEIIEFPDVGNSVSFTDQAQPHRQAVVNG